MVLDAVGCVTSSSFHLFLFDGVVVATLCCINNVPAPFLYLCCRKINITVSSNEEVEDKSDINKEGKACLLLENQELAVQKVYILMLTGAKNGKKTSRNLETDVVFNFSQELEPEIFSKLGEQ